MKISEALCTLVSQLQIKPAFVAAKGGITSADVATKGLRMKEGTVLGQILPSVPVYKTSEDSRFGAIPYVIFPGNTGEDTSLKEAVEILTGKE